MTASYWFNGWSDADPVDRRYPLRALAEGAEADAGTSSVDPEASLVPRIRAGDEVAFAELYRGHAAGLLGYAYRLCGSRATAQDVVAELFTHLWERRVSWVPRSSVRAYLYTAIRHRVMNALRTERRADTRAAQVVAEVTMTVTAEPEESRDPRLDAVWRVIDAFPPLRRQVMYLRWARGLTPEEIATVLGLNRNAVDKHLSRALRAIRETFPDLIAGA